MRGPVIAMLWESWRLTRYEILFRVLAAAGLGVVVLSLSEGSESESSAATITLLLVATVGGMFSTWTLRFDNRGGFPFVLGFVRPIKTWYLVAVPMVYLCLAWALAYLVPILLLRLIFDIPFPLLPMAAIIVTLSIVLAAANWWSRGKFIRVCSLWVTAVCLIIAARLLLPESIPGNDIPPELWPTMFGFSWSNYVLLGVIVVTAFGITVHGVERQRRGDDRPHEKVDGDQTTSEVLGWLTGFLRHRCPATSPTRAQLWFEMKAVGWEVLFSGLIVTIAIPVGFAVVALFHLNPKIALPVFFVALLAPLTTSFRGLSAIQRKQGYGYLSTFDATVPIKTAPLVGIKIGVTAACVVFTWILIVTSYWWSLDILQYAGMAGAIKDRIASALISASAETLAALFGAAVIGLLIALACYNALRVLRVLYPRRLMTLTIGICGYVVALFVGQITGWVTLFVIEVHLWMLIAAALIGCLIIIWRSVAARTLAPVHLIIATTIWCFAVACAVIFLDQPATLVAALPSWLTGVLILGAFLPLAAFAVAPWSFALLRHR